ncbi:lantibiotic immunity ABC transporter MutE/EpiE family permease subunit [Ruminococcus sp. 5_1_39BFAA]|uniref:lantibiotic immunity ABC transporter MutE/EpiE family permease subunit n=1 Tax=Ruminococcus sp. 5_1_39BFAA TaxID=457412 RepID=UPI003564F4F3
MKRYFRAEKLKYRHTFLKGIVVLMPLISVFFSAMLTHAYFAVDSYNWWYMILYPGMLGIVCGMIGGKDKRKKNFTIWSLPCSMEKIWDAKVLLGAALSGIAVGITIILTIIMGQFMESALHMKFIIQPSLKMQLTAGLLMWLTTLWQIPFCLLLSQKMGTFVMLLIHMGSYAIISAAISLKPWFAALPGAITSRLMCPVLGILPNGLPAVEGQMTYSPELMELQNLMIGLPAAILWFLILWLVSRKWFERQVTV